MNKKNQKNINQEETKSYEVDFVILSEVEESDKNIKFHISTVFCITFGTFGLYSYNTIRYNLFP